MEDSYDDLQTQIHNQISEQSEAIHSLTASIEESEQEGKQLSQKVFFAIPLSVLAKRAEGGITVQY